MNQSHQQQKSLSNIKKQRTKTPVNLRHSSLSFPNSRRASAQNTCKNPGPTQVLTKKLNFWAMPKQHEIAMHTDVSNKMIERISELSQIPSPHFDDSVTDNTSCRAPFITGVKIPQQEPTPAYNSHVTVDLKNYLTENLKA
jgi:hypothetical protein